MLNPLPEAGQYYRSRDGNRVLVKRVTRLFWPVEAYDDNGTSFHFHRGGNFYEHVQSPHDLVALWEEPIVVPITYQRKVV